MSVERVRPEAFGDASAIDRVLVEAFGRDEERDLVRSLRSHGRISIGLVAEENEEVVGYISFIPLTLEPSVPGVAPLGLAPVAVTPDFQRKGIGAKLIREGLRMAEERGFNAVLLLGDPLYYRRFEFVSASRYGFVSPFNGDEAYFMARIVDSDFPTEQFQTTPVYPGDFAMLSE